MLSDIFENSRRIALTAALGSAVLLGAAFLFQVIGYAPCKMCLWQRWPHVAAIVIGLAFLALGHRALLWLGAISAAVTSGIGFFHAGVEQGWWEGPSSCTGGGDALSGLSASDLISTDIAETIVMCDEIAWQIFGISMAAWNGLFSLALVALWVFAATRKT